MKKVTILITMMLVASISLVSFKNKTGTSYGGSASVKVKVVDADYNCTMRKVLDKVSNGDTRIIEVTTSCIYSDVAKAKESLKREIEYQTKCYEKLATSIDYDITTCN
jgi:hypothetical protein